MRSRPTSLASVAFWIAAIVAFVFAVLPDPPSLPGEPPDKINHMIAFAALGILGTLGYPRVRPFRLLLWLAIIGAVIELVQLIPSLHRDGDLLDLCVDVLAAGAAITMTRFAMRRILQARS